jgi:hypothetical protein
MVLMWIEFGLGSLGYGFRGVYLEGLKWVHL